MILVTGSAGHLGEGLMRTLRAEGRLARGLDRRSSPFTDIVGSISDPATVAAAMAGVRIVLHTATLHKPHVETHGAQDFIDTNVTGTLMLLEAATAAGVRAFVFTSTTSAFGSALRPGPEAPAAWVTEAVAPVPRNIYGVTKTAAEDLAELAHRRDGLPVIILRTSRFFPEGDDDPDVRTTYGRDNAQVNELLYRRIDLADVVSAHLLAAERAARLGFGRFILSATTPFRREDCPVLRHDAAGMLAQRVPEARTVYAMLGWRMFPTIDRVYVNDRARTALGWEPAHGFAEALARLARGESFRSPLALSVGSKGYHDPSVDPGLYHAV